jgi:hypothetical protein
VIVAAAPAVLLRLNVAEDAPEAEAVTEYDPAMVFAVKLVAVAMPPAFVVSVSVAVLFTNVPLAPVDGAVNVTVTFPIGDPLFVTVTVNGWNDRPTCSLCGVEVVEAVITSPEDPDELPPPHPDSRPKFAKTTTTIHTTPRNPGPFNLA